MSDKIISVESPEHRSEIERRQHQRRREDQVRTLEQAADLLARERRYEILRAAIKLIATGEWMVGPAIATAIDALERIEQLEERERQGKDESK